MTQVKLTHADATTDTIDSTVSFKDQREIGQMRKFTATVDRDAAKAASPVPKEDEMELVGHHTGRLVDIEKGGATWTLIGYAFEWDAKLETPTDGGALKSGTDNALIADFIGDVSTWTAGSIATLTGSMDYVFNHAFAHEALRRIEKNVPGELSFNADKSVDYVDDLGTDKTASVTLSAAQGNLNGEIQIKDINRDLDSTHLRVIGAHEGEAQIYANLVPSSDGATYANRVNYTTARWSSGDTRNWGRWSNKDVVSQSAIEEEAAALGAELQESYIEATATVEGEDLALGDWIHVEKPDADLDRDMRVHRITTKGTGAKVVDEVLLSTRTVARQSATSRAADVQRFNSAFQGSAVWGTPSGGYQAVTSTENYRLTFFYPDVAFEHVAELYVESQPYRTFHAGAASGGDHTHSVNVTHPSHTHDVTHPSHNHNVDVQSPDHVHDATQIIDRQTEAASGHTHLYDDRNDGNNANLFSTSTNTETSTTALGTTETSTTALGTTQSETSDASGDHTHPVDPGVSTFAGTTASGVDVLVNGGTVATNIGSGSFEATVDITGELTKGAFNTVELTSDSTGWLYAVAGLEAYRQIGKN